MNQDKSDIIIEMLRQLDQRVTLLDQRTTQQFSEMRAENAQQFERVDRQLAETRAENAQQFERVDRQLAENRAENAQQFERVDRQLVETRAENAQQFERVDRQLAETRAESIRQHQQNYDLLREEKRDREKMEDKLEKVYEARNQVTVNFTRAFALGNASIAAVIAVIISFFMPHR